MIVYRFTIHDDTGKRIDDSDDEMTDAELEKALAGLTPMTIDGAEFWTDRAGLIVSYVSEAI